MGQVRREHTNLSGSVDVTGHDANLAFSRLDDTRTVRSDEASLVLTEESVLNANHVLLRNTFCDTNSELHFSLNCFQNGSSSKRRRYVDDGGIGSSFLDSLCIISKKGGC
jgi:hypothetical protein